MKTITDKQLKEFFGIGTPRENDTYVVVPTDKLICKVWYAKVSDTKLVTIPKKCSIKPGQFVKIELVE